MQMGANESIAATRNPPNSSYFEITHRQNQPVDPRALLQSYCDVYIDFLEQVRAHCVGPLMWEEKVELKPNGKTCANEDDRSYLNVAMRAKLAPRGVNSVMNSLVRTGRLHSDMHIHLIYPLTQLPTQLEGKVSKELRRGGFDAKELELLPSPLHPWRLTHSIRAFVEDGIFNTHWHNVELRSDEIEVMHSSCQFQGKRYDPTLYREVLQRVRR